MLLYALRICPNLGAHKYLILGGGSRLIVSCKINQGVC